MLLQYLIKDLEEYEVEGNLKIDINKIEYDSKKIGQNDLFCAINGYKENGNDYIDEAIKKGAKCIIYEGIYDITNYEDITFIKVNDSRIALAKISATFYDYPARKLNLIAITGTKGKTSTAYMIRDILNASSKRTGMIGTIYNTYNDVKIEATRTSPESLDLHRLLREMVDNEIEYVVMEVSSHAISLNRIYGLHFRIGIFTNLSEDHLDFHKTMDNYLETKAKLFDICDFAIINGDDIYAPRLKKMIKCKIATFGLDNAVNVTATDITISGGFVQFKMYVNKMLETIVVNIPGRFTVYNALAAIATATLFNCQMDAIILALANVKVPGRSEIIDINKTFNIMIDYAHNPASLEAILTATKKHAKSRVILVFGCGGNREKEKRKIMGSIAGRLADFTVITTDNPRDEEPKEICKEIEMGIKETRGLYKIIENRRQAISFAMKIAWKNDIVIVAGKGHETYQEFKNNKKIKFDERRIIKEIASKMPDKNVE